MFSSSRFGLRYATLVLTSAVLSLLGAPCALAGTSWLDFSGGTAGWTTQGTVTSSSSPVSLTLGTSPFTLAPASGETMVEISPKGAPIASVDSMLGLSSNSIEDLLNNSNGQVTNFGVLTNTLTLNAGTYTFGWAYAAQDYQPYNDGVLFSLVGNGTQSITSLARNGSSSTDKSGPQAGTLILGSYGSTPWETASFTIATAGSYQLGFADYNWMDTGLDPLMFVAGDTGTFTGTPVSTTSGAPAVTTIGTSGGDISSAVFGTSSSAYTQAILSFDGGTLQYGADTTTTKDATLDSNGGTIDTGGNSITYSGVISGAGALTKIGTGTLSLSAVNTYTGATTISGGTLSLLGAGNIADSSAVVDNGTFDISGTSAGTSIQTLSGTGAIALGANTLTLAQASDTFSGSISGTGGLTLSGGTEVLTGTNSYSGTTSVDAGATLAVSGAGSIADTTVIDNGTFDVSAVNDFLNLTAIDSLSGDGSVILGNNTLVLHPAAGDFSGAVSGTGGLVVAAGNETLSGANTYSGATYIDPNATLALAGWGSIAASSSVIDDGTLDVSTAISPNILSLSGSGAVTLGANTLTIAQGADSFSGSLEGAGGLNVAGGSEGLSGNNAYSGATSIAQGATLALSGAGSIASSSGVADEGTFDVSASTGPATIQTLSGSGSVVLGANELVLNNASGSFSGTITGTGALAVTAGVEALTGVNTYSGGTSIGNGATLVAASDAALGATSGTVSLDGGTLEAASSFTLSQPVSLPGEGTLATDAGTTLGAAGTISGSGALIKAGAGTLVISGDNQSWGKAGTAQGGLTIEDGEVLVTNSNGLGNGTVTLNGGQLRTASNITLTQPISIAGGTSISTDAGTVTTLTNVSTGAGANGCFVKTGGGTLALDGADSLTFGTCVEQGQLQANGALTSSVSVSPGALLRGIGAIAGPVTVQGTLAPGHSPGTLTVNGTVTMASGSTFEEDINGTGTGTGPGNYSRLVITGKGNKFVTNGATLAPNLTQITGTDTYIAYVPTIGNTFDIVTAQGGIVGRFASLTQPNGLASGTRFAAFYDTAGNNSIVLRVVPSSYGEYFTGAGLNGNARATGAAIDALAAIDGAGMATARQDELFYDLAGLSAAKLKQAASALDGEVHGDLAAVAPLHGEWLESTVDRELAVPQSVAGHRGSPGNAFWFDTGASHGHWHADQASSGFSSNSAYLAAGWDALATPSARAGIGFSHALTALSSTTGSGSIEQDMFFAYGQKSTHGIVFNALTGYGFSGWNTLRADPLGLTGALTTHADGRTVLASLGVSVPRTLRAVSVEPYARLLWQKSTRNAFDEATTSPAAVDALSGPQYSSSGTRLTAGVAIGSVVKDPFATRVTYQLDLGVARDAKGLTDPATYAVLGEEQFKLATPNVGRVAVLARFGGTLRLTPRVITYLGVSGEGRGGTSANYGAQLGVRAVF